MGLLTELFTKSPKIAKGLYDDIYNWYVSRGFPDSVAERIASGELPMDYESRMARASQRFDIDNPEYTGSADLLGDIYTPVWSSQNTSLAATYANPRNGGNITPVFLDRSGVSTVRADGTRWNNINDSGRSTNDYMRKAQDYGLPSVAFRDIRDVGPYTAGYPRELLEQAFEPSNTTVTLDPNKIRSVNAAFDPEYTGPNILGTTAATAGALGLLAAPEDAAADTGATLAATQPSYIDQAFNALEMPYRGYLGATRLGGGLLAGENFDTALNEAVRQIKQPVEQTAMESGDEILKRTGSPEAATLWNLIMQLGSPI